MPINKHSRASCGVSSSRESLQLQDCLEDAESPPVYDLYGVVNHHSLTATLRHYTACCMVGEGSDKWRLCDDAAGKPLNAQDVVTKDAYVLFYKERTASATAAGKAIDAQQSGGTEGLAGLPHLKPAHMDLQPPDEASGSPGIKAGNQHYQHHWTSFFCTQGQPVKQAGPDISLLNSVLQQQWDHAANAHLGKTVIKPYSAQKVWWTCDQCPDGHLHSWSATVNSRSNGNGCPQCRGRKVCKHNSLATRAPLVAAQWDHEANDGTPDSVVAQSHQPVGWLCDVCGGRWTARPNCRTSRTMTGCPECAEDAKCTPRTKQPTFAECQHPLLAEWDHERNAAQGHRPDKVRLKSNKQIFWLCTRCPAGQEHSWSAQPGQRTARGKSGCPYCAGKAACRCNSLQALYPGIAAEWDHARNKGQPSNYTASSHRPAWWSSSWGGSWQQTITSRTSAVHQRTARLERIQRRHVDRP
ncbi:hypothetical protein ABBQ38_008271 [Trebouxia sp. C0009 RCD-2024]